MEYSEYNIIFNNKVCELAFEECRLLYLQSMLYSILDIYHAFKYKVVCHVVLKYDEDLSGYWFLVVGVHGFVFEECRLARHLLAYYYHYTTISSEYVI